MNIDAVALTVVIVLFVVVTVCGFMAARWRRAESLMHLDEWGLGGRSFGTFVTWFLLGGDLYTAYTFIAVPAAMYGAGAVSGFFAVPYTIVLYPIIFIFLPRLWSVSHVNGYVTPADFVRGRYDSRTLTLAVTVTGILATMPYIALQLVGIQAVIETMGLGGGGNVLARDLPLFIAFAVLAAYTYSSGLRAPALIAFIKDTLIYLVVIVAVIYIPYKLGGFGRIFDSAQAALTQENPATGKPFGSIIPASSGYSPYVTLALGSAMALFMYPHAITGSLAARSRLTLRRNAAVLPIYSFMLGLLALIGYMAYAANIKPVGLDGNPNPQLVVPMVFEHFFPSWFAGVGYAAIAIGALVPAAIMSIAAANLFTRNLYREYLRPDATPAQEAKVSKVASLVVKLGALVFVLFLDRTLALNFQLLGGIWILQTFPAIVCGLFTRWLHRWALLAGWAVGMAYGTVVAYQQVNPATGRHFGSSVGPIPFLGEHTGYIAVTAFVLNLLVAVLGTAVLRALRAPAGTDRTLPSDYHAEAAEPGDAAAVPAPQP